MSIHWPILRTSLRQPGRLAMVDDQRSYRAIELLIGAAHLASAIEATTQRKHVGLLLPTGGVFPMVALAAWMTGKVIVPLNYLLKPEELQYVINDCDADLVVSVRPLLEHLGFTPRHVRLLHVEDVSFSGFPEPRWPALADPEDLGVLLYTSGTTGKPKGVMLTHGNIRANIEQARRCARFTTRDTFLGVLPQFHSFGFTVLTVLPLAFGCKVVFTARFVPTKILRLLREYRPTVFVGIPSMYAALLHSKSAEPGDFTSLRYAVCGGEPLPDSVASGFKERFGVTICEGYGLTETAPVTHICLPEHYVPHTVGKPVPRVSQRIVDVESARPLGPNQEGEIRLDGPNIMRGYYKLPQETSAVFDEQGYFRTGDMGHFDAEGRLFITGRLKEMIIVGGENVFPREIEEVLNAHESVAASAVIGVADDVRGELPWAFVELVEGHSFDEVALRSWCRDRLAGYKVPREIRQIEELPRNPTGKIMRRELAAYAPQA